MAKTLIIPSKFTAEDGLTPFFERAGRASQRFTNGLETMNARSERAFRKLTPALSAASKQLLSMVGTAALVGGAFQLGRSSVQSIMDYETAMQSLQAVTGASDEKMFDLKKEINSLSGTSRKSAKDVAASFETIGSAMSQYLDDPKGLRQIAEAGITLSKAARTELQPTLEDLTSIMNQFGLRAEDAAKSVDILTAGEIVGSIRTSEAAGYLKDFGATAKNMGVDLAESTALIEALGVQMSKDKIGVGARNLLTIISAAGGLDKKARGDLKSAGVNMNFLMDNTQSLSSRLRELSKISKDPIKMVSVFGKENLTAGQVIFNQLDKYDAFEKRIRVTSEAQKQAALNSNTLSNRLDELSNAWANMLTSSDGATSGLNQAKRAIQYVTDNLGEIVSVGVGVLKFFALWKAQILVTRAAIGLYNIAMGATGAITGIVNIAVGKSKVGLYAYRAATAAVTAAQWLWNAAMSANPIGLVIVGVATLVAGLAYLATQFDGWGDQWDIIIKGMGYSTSAFAYYFKAQWGGISDYFMSSIETMQLGWFAFQNAIGQMSDQQYSAQKTGIAKDRFNRARSIAENTQLAKYAAANASLYTDNVLTLGSSSGENSDDENVASKARQQQLSKYKTDYVARFVQKNATPSSDVGSSNVARTMNESVNTNNNNQNMVLTVKNASDSEVDVKDGFNKNFSIMPKMTSTMSTKK